MSNNDVLAIVVAAEWLIILALIRSAQKMERRVKRLVDLVESEDRRCRWPRPATMEFNRAALLSVVRNLIRGW